MNLGHVHALPNGNSPRSQFFGALFGKLYRMMRMKAMHGNPITFFKLVAYFFFYSGYLSFLKSSANLDCTRFPSASLTKGNLELAYME